MGVEAQTAENAGSLFGVKIASNFPLSKDQFGYDRIHRDRP